MRAYLPGTFASLSAALETGRLDAGLGYAVTPALREWYTEGDLDELEYAALSAAARASLHLIAEPGYTGPARRVVLAVELGERDARPAPEAGRAAVRLAAPVALSEVASAHVDDESAQDDVRRAAAALAAADAGDEDAAFVVDGVDDHELGWYAAQELNILVELG